MKKITLFIMLIAFTTAVAQQNYYDFDSIRRVAFKDWGMAYLDTNVTNPDTLNLVNSSRKCGLYVRDTVWYSNFKIYSRSLFADAAAYASSSSTAPKLTMKVYSNAPTGTRINLQLGVKHWNNYPDGVHSEYTGFTTATRSWHTVTFNFTGKPANGWAHSTNLDKLVVLFRPASATRDTMYFDDIMGPENLVLGVDEKSGILGSLQNIPNPASESTTIRLNLEKAASVNIDLYDIVGNKVREITSGTLSAGNHDFSVDTRSLPSGVYFYTASSGRMSDTRKMIVTH